MVVNFCSCSNSGIARNAFINGTCGSNLNPIANFNTTARMHFFPTLRSRFVVKSIATKDCIRVDDAVIANIHIIV